MDRDPTVKIKRGRGCSPARFPACFSGVLRTGNGRRQRCSRFWTAERLRRVAGGRYDLFCLICVLEFAQTREGGAAGARLWRRQASGGHGDLDSLRFRGKKWVRELRQEEEESLGGEGEGRLTCGGEFERNARRCCGLRRGILPA
jgi:hypothetical protein